MLPDGWAHSARSVVAAVSTSVSPQGGRSDASSAASDTFFFQQFLRSHRPGAAAAAATASAMSARDAVTADTVGGAAGAAGAAVVGGDAEVVVLEEAGHTTEPASERLAEEGAGTTSAAADNRTQGEGDGEGEEQRRRQGRRREVELLATRVVRRAWDLALSAPGCSLAGRIQAAVFSDLDAGLLRLLFPVPADGGGGAAAAASIAAASAGGAKASAGGDGVSSADEEADSQAADAEAKLISVVLHVFRTFSAKQGLLRTDPQNNPFLTALASTQAEMARQMQGIGYVEEDTSTGTGIASGGGAAAARRGGGARV
jgi:hypothetical protein